MLRFYSKMVLFFFFLSLAVGVFCQSARVVDVTNGSELFVGDVTGGSSGKLEYETVTTATIPVNNEQSALQWILDVFNPFLFGDKELAAVEPACAKDMRTYITALREDQPWSAKMFDASGRYSSQFFFGNNFWLGSEGLCHELGDPKLNKKIPPYDVAFKVAKLSLAVTQALTPQRRVVLLGLCLPAACSPGDTQALLQFKAEPGINGTGMAVLGVRSVPGDYVIMKDVRFQVLGGSILVVICFLVLGTLYEYWNNKKAARTSASMRTNDVENNNHKMKGGLDLKSAANVYKVSPPSADNEKKAEETRETAKSEDTQEKGVLAEMFASFSVMSNGSKILNCNHTSDDSVTAVHGLRFFSLTWVIMVHTYLQVFAIAENKTFRAVTERSFMYQTIGNATFSVDSFFFISGLLVSYLFFKAEGDKKSDKDGNLKIIFSKFTQLVIYRFIRLTPVYIIVLGMIQMSMRFIHNNSVFEPTVMDHENCEDFWWRNVLYVNNLYPRTQMCMLWSWYMATDTQFFVLSSLLLLFAKKRLNFTAATAGLILVSCWITTAVVSYVNSYEARVEEPFALFDELYDKPWTRMGPYLVGMFTGWLLYKTNCKITMSTPVVVLGWASSCACLLSLVYGLGSGLGVALSAVYVALGHTAWGACLGWIVVACRSGYGGWVNTFLSFPALYPLSRLTYCAYLVHPLIMFLTIYVMDGPFHIHNGIIVIVFLGNIVASFLLSFLLSLAFEAPIVRLLKLAMTPRHRRT